MVFLSTHRINTLLTYCLRDILPRTGYLPWFEGAQGAVVVYDCATPSEFDAMKWKQELDGISTEW